MHKSPDISGASVTAIEPAAAEIQLGKMPVVSTVPQNARPEFARRPRGDERSEVKFLHLTLGRGKDAQDLLIQTAKERGDDVSSTNGPKTLFVIRMHPGTLGSLFVALF